MDIEEKVNNFVLFEVFNSKKINEINCFCLNCQRRQYKKKRSVVVVAFVVKFVNHIFAEAVIFYTAVAFVFFVVNFDPHLVSAFRCTDSDLFIRTYQIAHLRIVLTFDFFLAAA